MYLIKGCLPIYGLDLIAHVGLMVDISSCHLVSLGIPIIGKATNGWDLIGDPRLMVDKIWQSMENSRKEEMKLVMNFLDLVERYRLIT